MTAGPPPAPASPPRGHLCLLVRDLWQTIMVPCKSLFPRECSSSADSSCPCRNSACLVLLAHLSFLTAARSSCPVQDRKHCSFGPNPSLCSGDGTAIAQYPSKRCIPCADGWAGSPYLALQPQALLSKGCQGVGAQRCVPAS